jgi:hypothetical protein
MSPSAYVVVIAFRVSVIVADGSDFSTISNSLLLIIISLLFSNLDGIYSFVFNLFLVDVVILH